MTVRSSRLRHRSISGISLAVVVSLAAFLAVALGPCAVWAQAVNVYSRTANGDVPPLRILAGPATGLSSPEGDDVDREQ